MRHAKTKKPKTHKYLSIYFFLFIFILMLFLYYFFRILFICFAVIFSYIVSST